MRGWVCVGWAGSLGVGESGGTEELLEVSSFSAQPMLCSEKCEERSREEGWEVVERHESRQCREDCRAAVQKTQDKKVGGPSSGYKGEQQKRGKIVQC